MSSAKNEQHKYSSIKTILNQRGHFVRLASVSTFTDVWMGQLYLEKKIQKITTTFSMFVHIHKKQQTKMLREMIDEIYLITTGQKTNLQEIKPVLVFVWKKPANRWHRNVPVGRDPCRTAGADLHVWSTPEVTAFCLGAGRGVGKPVLLVCWMSELLRLQEGLPVALDFLLFVLLKRILLQSLLFL